LRELPIFLFRSFPSGCPVNGQDIEIRAIGKEQAARTESGAQNETYYARRKVNGKQK
jgi:hypothetical protein